MSRVCKCHQKPLSTTEPIIGLVCNDVLLAEREGLTGLAAAAGNATHDACSNQARSSFVAPRVQCSVSIRLVTN